MREQSRTWYATIPGRGRVSLGTTDEGAAWQELRRLLRDAELRAAGVRDAETDAARLPLADQVREWATAHLAHRGLTAKHRSAYLSMATRLASLAGWQRLADVDADSCRRALSTLASEGAGAGTRRNHLSAVRAFLRWCRETGRLSGDPLAGVRTPPLSSDVRHERRLASPEELRRLFAHLDSPDARKRRGVSPRARALGYRLALYCGLRAGEVCRLEAGAFDLANRTVTIAASSDKRRRRAVLPLPGWLAEEVREHLAGTSPSQHPWERLTPAVTSRVLAADLRAAGVEPVLRGPDGPLHLDFHALRHWYCTQLAHTPGISPKALLELARHGNPALTLLTYAHAQEAQMRAAAEGLPRV